MGGTVTVPGGTMARGSPLLSSSLPSLNKSMEDFPCDQHPPALPSSLPAPSWTGESGHGAEPQSSSPAQTGGTGKTNKPQIPNLGAAEVSWIFLNTWRTGLKHLRFGSRHKPSPGHSPDLHPHVGAELSRSIPPPKKKECKTLLSSQERARARCHRAETLWGHLEEPQGHLAALPRGFGVVGVDSRGLMEHQPHPIPGVLDPFNPHLQTTPPY